MNKKIYTQLLNLVYIHIQEIDDYFDDSFSKFQKDAKEVSSKSYGGYESKQLFNNFKKELNTKCEELLKNIEKMFINSGRKLTHNQYDELIAMCQKTFDSIIDKYSNLFEENYGQNETMTIHFNNFRERISSKIKLYIYAFEIMTNTKIDKVFVFTVIGVVLTIISIIVSIASILI